MNIQTIPNIVGLWALDNVTYAKDKTPYGNNGSPQGGIVIGDSVDHHGQAGRATTFDGNNDYVNFGGQIIKQNIFTISAWIKPSRYGVVNQGNGIFYQGTGVAMLGTMFCVINSVVGLNTIGGIYEGGTYVSATPNSITLNIWQHVVMVFSAGTVAYYINGVSKGGGSGMGSGVPVAQNGNIGYWYDVADISRYFQGSISDVHIYNRAITQTEITMLYNDYNG